MNDPLPFFSVVIPTRNESTDILKTLSSIRENTCSDYEVLVVDASQDDTPQRVRDFGDSRVRLLRQDNTEGRCGARNQGIRQARGEIVLILNADVRLPPRFLERLQQHYAEGADYVIVDSTVENREHPFGAMVEAEHHYLYHSGRETVNWCEGYSCRRACALEAGLFPEGFIAPICAGEDAVFGENMARRFRRKTDLQLVVAHSVPENLGVFWSQRIGRGQGCAQRHVLLEGWPLRKALLDGLRWTFKSILWIGLVVPMVRYAQKLAHAAPPSETAQWRVKTHRLIWPLLLSRAGHEIGRWKGFFEIRRKLRQRR